jgi:hypothetical protein
VKVLPRDYARMLAAQAQTLSTIAEPESLDETHKPVMLARAANG